MQPLTRKNEYFIIRGQQVPIFVPSEYRRGDGIGLTVQGEGIIKDHILHVSIITKARVRVSKASETWGNWATDRI